MEAESSVKEGGTVFAGRRHTDCFQDWMWECRPHSSITWRVQSQRGGLLTYASTMGLSSKTSPGAWTCIDPTRCSPAPRSNFWQSEVDFNGEFATGTSETKNLLAVRKKTLPGLKQWEASKEKPAMEVDPLYTPTVERSVLDFLFSDCDKYCVINIFRFKNV